MIVGCLSEEVKSVAKIKWMCFHVSAGYDTTCAKRVDNNVLSIPLYLITVPVTLITFRVIKICNNGRETILKARNKNQPKSFLLHFLELTFKTDQKH